MPYIEGFNIWFLVRQCKSWHLAAAVGDQMLVQAGLSHEGGFLCGLTVCVALYPILSSRRPSLSCTFLTANYFLFSSPNLTFQQQKGSSLLHVTIFVGYLTPTHIQYHPRRAPRELPTLPPNKCKDECACLDEVVSVTHADGGK